MAMVRPNYWVLTTIIKNILYIYISMLYMCLKLIIRKEKKRKLSFEEYKHIYYTNDVQTFGPHLPISIHNT